MAARHGGHSRLVRLLKFGLPLLALVLLATLFLFSRRIDPGRAIPIVGIDIGRILADQGIGSPNFVGRTNEGDTVRIDAAHTAINNPGEGDSQASEVTASITSSDGRVMTFSAQLAVFSRAGKTATFTGNVIVGASPDMTIRSEELVASTDLSEFTSPGPITADGPMGHLQAGSMNLSRPSGDGASGGYLLVFQDAVRLIYTPAS